jgi:hypothetical protein
LLAKLKSESRTFSGLRHELEPDLTVTVLLCCSIALCEMHIESNSKDTSRAWLLAHGFLNRLRSQVFLQPLMGAIPAVVLTQSQGGSALKICFNTIAVLFILEVCDGHP